MTLDLQKKFYAELVAAKGGVRDEAIIAAFAATDRAKFVGSAPGKSSPPLVTSIRPAMILHFSIRTLLSQSLPSDRSTTASPVSTLGVSAR
jgi:hypothetical protein